MEDKKPKKRGRKPKNKTATGTKSKKETNVEISENLIIKLNHSEVDEYDITGYNNSEENEDIKKESSSELCWNCCHCFHEHTYGIPLKYLNKIFYTYGDFCSLECAARYTLDNLREYNFSEIYSLINLYNNTLLNKIEKVEIAPSRLVLKSFGGPLTIDEYRSNFSNKDIYDLRIPPILPIKHSINKYEMNNTTNQNNLKLYRKKPLPSEKKSITSSMNLIIG
tara:strand:- start:644 stop:1312 length:669 start_codon:yes stop_codon:yes gene_type:complete